jgi:hypothetical protein
MTRLSLALCAVVAVAMLATSPRSTAAIEYPWCAQYSGGDEGGGRNCGFSTLEQCMETIHGIGGSCEHNLFYEAPEQQPGKPPHKHSHD